MTTRMRSFISVPIALVLVIGFALSPRSAAHAITQAQIASQETVVKEHLLATLEEQLKLLQMHLIVKLEERVAVLIAAQ